MYKYTVTYDGGETIVTQERPEKMKKPKWAINIGSHPFVRLNKDGDLCFHANSVSADDWPALRDMIDELIAEHEDSE